MKVYNTLAKILTNVFTHIHTENLPEQERQHEWYVSGRGSERKFGCQLEEYTATL